MAGLFPDNKEEFNELIKAQEEYQKHLAKNPYTSEQMIKDLEEAYGVKVEKKVGLIIEDVTPVISNMEQLKEKFGVGDEDLDVLEQLKSLENNK